MIELVARIDIRYYIMYVYHTRVIELTTQKPNAARHRPTPRGEPGVDSGILYTTTIAAACT